MDSLSRESLRKAADESLQTACTFFAACSVQVTPSHLSDDLAQWWEECGKELLLGEMSLQEEDSDESDSEDVAEMPETGVLEPEAGV